MFARNRLRTSSSASYDSESGSGDSAAVIEGSVGRVTAGPRVRVRRGSNGKLPTRRGDGSSLKMLL